MQAAQITDWGKKFSDKKGSQFSEGTVKNR